MARNFQREEPNKKEELKITYYFTLFMTLVGTLLIMFLLSYKVEELNLFVVLLSISAGGLPLGIVGAYFDYRMAIMKKKYQEMKYRERLSGKGLNKSLE